MDGFGKAFGLIILFPLLWASPAISPAADSGCLACHNGIESIREESSAMLQLINSLSAVHGDTAGCVMCHGGDPTTSDAGKAHEGSPQSLVDFKGPQTFYPDPGAMDINKFTCGQSACHAGYEERLEKSLMNTEAGKIQGNLHTWGIPEVMNHKVPWGNYDVKDGDGPVPSVGTDAYKNRTGANPATQRRRNRERSEAGRLYLSASAVPALSRHRQGA
jgi:hypothetical protein